MRVQLKYPDRHYLKRYTSWNNHSPGTQINKERHVFLIAWGIPLRVSSVIPIEVSSETRFEILKDFIYAFTRNFPRTYVWFLQEVFSGVLLG